MNLIVVESPAKARTIEGFLGKEYKVVASKGHIKDLRKFGLGVTIGKGEFTPHYVLDEGHKDLIEELKKLSLKAKKTYIATDEDREGEAIGFHVAEELGLTNVARIAFHEITKGAILKALQNPRKINMDMVYAQQARRLLDRIVGFKLSSFVRSKVQGGLSAGRVQSAALKLVIDREREIKAFEPIIYFSLDAIFRKEVEAILVEVRTPEGILKIDKLTLQDKSQAEGFLKEIKKDTFIVKNIEEKTKSTPPPPP